jgi:Asp23 family, cell envelope-related function
VNLVLDGPQGTITVPAQTLASLVVQAAESVEGARIRRARRHVDVTLIDGHARVSLELVARYGEVLPELARSVQEKVTDALTTMCGVIVDTVDVEVEEIE